jgi:A/G-specific adenine glycosylase
MPCEQTTRPAVLGSYAARNVASIQRQLLTWFDAHGEDWPWRRTRDRWLVLISEICLQQTQAGRVVPFYERITDRFPTPAAMAAAPLHDLLTLWQGLGYPRRARNLYLAAQQIVQGGWPDDYRELPGVGPYTAAALECFADEKPSLPLDINVQRVVSRLFPDGAPEPPKGQGWAWGQAVMELGQTSCRAKAKCDQCPMNRVCPSRGTVQVIASARQSTYRGSMRQRRGTLLKALTGGERVPMARDREAADSLVADALAARNGRYLVPIA